jgi:hypothetical protein
MAKIITYLTKIWYLFIFQFSNGKDYMANISYKNIMITENVVSIHIPVQ